MDLQNVPNPRAARATMPRPRGDRDSALIAPRSSSSAHPTMIARRSPWTRGASTDDGLGVGPSISGCPDAIEKGEGEVGLGRSSASPRRASVLTAAEWPRLLSESRASPRCGRSSPGRRGLPAVAAQRGRDRGRRDRARVYGHNGRARCGGASSWPSRYHRRGNCTAAANVFLGPR
jgi:hypothetical protein